MNTQKIEKLATSDKDLEYVDLFYTIQGEGPFAGRPAVFLRLAGCNLQCKFCDTDYTSNRKVINVAELVDKLKNDFKCRFLVITGGEPLRQAGAVSRLLRNIIDAWEVQIETNGTLSVENLYNKVSIVVSPKARIHHSVYSDQKTTYFKFLVSCDTFGSMEDPTDCNGIGILPAAKHGKYVYLQPLDERDDGKNEKNNALVIELAKMHNFNVSAQLHKIWGIA